MLSFEVVEPSLGLALVISVRESELAQLHFVEAARKAFSECNLHLLK